jgi:hypothetical protein
MLAGICQVALSKKLRNSFNLQNISFQILKAIESRKKPWKV